ncbi:MULTISPECIES: uroporphyrinogen decarboxylase [Rhodococcus]|jgi:uroporphyrinogen decarboxylase|uniref:Uroporphyrinogen decarboxylase n=1 Tax=Rhodococcus aetherivorans TaxID=191292 RepID=N1M619_9NOCA|nr:MULTISPECIES: uroporphyrinogen decarboxylase [Rhodococcus]AKE89898.1 uroporphyrinogen decarboxylase [Rhodococcus aetherivorans]ANZ25378.1 uroporphyrinogen decarboxylase [Rhodococcus sp. WB1]KDE13629.1 uroporphyrinogen decarboxylase [Rhodococcus aetherivorans]MBC2587378.1 uroporphyrinogen decarboxylase [Rhodococcus aetherivorans]MDV6291836.1 uroporphyrinogen decarboxylase [Rhodococcus aetherivorans]
MTGLENTNVGSTPRVDYPTRRQLPQAPLLAAARGLEPAHRPVWFMRQAGRSLPEYREIRANIGMLESCFDPELVCEITLQPVRRHRVDAAILFSDIVVPLKAAGIDLDIVAGTGPVIANPVRTAADVAKLPTLEHDEVGAVARAVGLLTRELGDVPLIGFAGAPFTLASYLVEGGPSRNHERTKALMHADPRTWHALLGRLADITIAFLQAQLHAGVDAIQLFDSWAGALSLADYREFVLPHSERVFAEVESAGVPRIHFGVGTGELLGAMGEAGADVVGVDWRVPLDVAVTRVGAGKALQGNLDPAILFAGPEVVQAEVRRIVAEGDRARAAGATGHIFNLGHGVLPDTDPDVLTAVVELVHSL